MFLAKVVGTVVATQKHEGLEGVKLLVLQPVDEHGKPNDEPVIAVDGTRQAGPGETVYCIGGREGALVMEEWFTPVDHGILGIVDEIYVVVEGKPKVTLRGGHPTTGEVD